jgi:hypothetical protein
MAQKDLLGQDIFLVGPPGPLRRRLAMAYCEMAGRECEVVTLTQDTTESDLKQRREIKGQTALFSDQAPVRAALEGRVLILDGIDKAERNVLPTLNNLLENREMALADGRFLVNAARYDGLGLAAVGGDTPSGNNSSNSNGKSDYSSSSSSSGDGDGGGRLVRVSEDFRVIALGLPVPRFPGFALDPPLRSRFQVISLT